MHEIQKQMITVLHWIAALKKIVKLTGKHVERSLSFTKKVRHHRYLSLEFFKIILNIFSKVYLETNSSRGGSKTAATSKMERFVIIVNNWKPLTIITKRSILDVAVVLDPPLCFWKLRAFTRLS